MKCGKIRALEIFKTQQIRPKASILTSPSKGGHVLQRRTRPNPLHHAFGLAGRRGSPDYQHFTIFGFLACFFIRPYLYFDIGLKVHRHVKRKKF